MTPRCSTGCGAAASHEILAADGSPFPVSLYGCPTFVRDCGQPVRRLTPSEFGIVPAPRPGAVIPAAQPETSLAQGGIPVAMGEPDRRQSRPSGLAARASLPSPEVA